jgi:hypothetical protein
MVSQGGKVLKNGTGAPDERNAKQSNGQTGPVLDASIA